MLKMALKLFTHDSLIDMWAFGVVDLIDLTD